LPTGKGVKVNVLKVIKNTGSIASRSGRKADLEAEIKKNSKEQQKILEDEIAREEERKKFKPTIKTANLAMASTRARRTSVASSGELKQESEKEGSKSRRRSFDGKIPPQIPSLNVTSQSSDSNPTIDGLKSSSLSSSNAAVADNKMAHAQAKKNRRSTFHQ